MTGKMPESTRISAIIRINENSWSGSRGNVTICLKSDLDNGMA